MKYKVISAILTGMLTLGLFMEADSLQTQNIEKEGIEELSGETEAEADRKIDKVPVVGQQKSEDKILLCGGVRGYLEDRVTLQVETATMLAMSAFQNPVMATVSQAESVEMETIQELEECEKENEYRDLALARVSNYVNVREEANTESTIVGKIYDGAVAQIQETVDGEEGEWFKIVSGNVEGYIKAEFFLYGDAAAEVIDEYVTKYAVVLADRLNVREKPDVESKRMGYIDNGEKVKLLEKDGDWLKVQYTGSKAGYVAAEYVTVSEEFVYAKTLEEEAAEIAARKALEERQLVSEMQAAENTAITAIPPAGEYGDNSELRDAIIEYAKQFLGNKYVHGGRSLVTGTDCSGFTSLIYAEFGYSVSRTPEGQLANDGRSVDYSEIQPGDIICYGSGGKCTHVALYIGDGQIIHSANSRKGVVIYQADYDTIMGVKNIID